MSQRLAQEAPNGLSETSAAYGMIRASNRGGDSLERLCLLAVALLGVETAMIVLNWRDARASSRAAARLELRETPCSACSKRRDSLTGARSQSRATGFSAY